MPSRQTKARARESKSGTAAEREYEAYALEGIEDPRGDPDVLLDVPSLTVDAIHLEVDELDARVALRAKVLELVKLSAGVDAHLGRVRIDLSGVEAQALLKVRLDRVTAIVDRVLTTVDRNPELAESLGRAAEQVGEGAGHALGETGEATREVGSGAQEAAGEIGAGGGEAVEGLGEGAGEAAGEAGEGVGKAVGGAVEGAGSAAGEAGGAAASLLGGGDGGDGPAPSASGIAKLAVKMVAKELRSSAGEEAKELGLAAARKAKEVGERRTQRNAGQRKATEAALREAEELEVDLGDVEGSGPEGRITIRDVRNADEG